MPTSHPAGSSTPVGRQTPSSTDGLGAAAAAGRLQAGEVQAMFDRIAGVYDLLNGVMTAGLHHRWRMRAADLACVGEGDRVLDVATGTGDLALELAKRVGADGEVVGSDFSEGMLERARTKAGGAAAAGRLRFEWGDAAALPYPDGSFAAATVGFGARNFADLGKGLAEMTRVVRPGGRVVVLEITNPTKPPLSVFYRLWFDRVVPQLGALAGGLTASLRRGVGGAAGDGGEGTASIADAYTYLPSSVRRFPSPVGLAAEMQRAGLTGISWVLTAGGIIAIHAGTVRR
jgi:demethylmenaquinone methyltransferase/2-methoxy-6-polyprenyl-1,4-benzoquinol methylase